MFESFQEKYAGRHNVRTVSSTAVLQIIQYNDNLSYQLIKALARWRF
jgi:hypothetical protein